MKLPFVDKIADFILENYENQTDNLTVVFPNKRAALFLRNALAKRINKNIWLPVVWSIEEALEHWSNLHLVDSTQVFFELIDIELERKTKTIHLNEFGGLASQMSVDFEDVDQYMCDADKLFSHLSEAKTIERWHVDGSPLTESEKAYISFFNSLYGYYQELKRRLLDKNMAYQGMLTRMLAELPDTELAEKINHKIIFAGFNAITLAEETIIKRLVQSGNADILWDFDRYYLEENSVEQEAGFFARYFLDRFPKNKELFIGDNLLNDEKQIIVTGVPGTAIQAKAMAANLDNSCLTAKTAIVLADENMLIPVINSIPDFVENFNVTMGYPFSKTTVYQFVKLIFSLQVRKKVVQNDGSVYLWSVLSLVGHEINNILFKQTTLQKLIQWKNELMKLKVFYLQKEHFQLIEDDKELHEFVELLTQMWNNSTDAISVLNQILQKMADFLGKKADKESIFIMNQISIAGRILNRLSDIVKKYDAFFDLKNLEKLFEQLSNSNSIKLFGEPIIGTQIMGLLETRNIDFDTVHILGVNEGILPKEKSYQSLIPFDIRLAHQMPTYQEKQASYAYHFYRILQNSKHIYLYYNSEPGNLNGGEPSRYILQIKNELVKANPKIQFEERLFSIPLSNKNADGFISIDKTQFVMDQLNMISKEGFSPTSLANYNKCQLLFYLENILKIKDSSIDEKVQKNVLGTIVHKCLEQIYKPYVEADSNLSVDDLEKMKRNVDDKLKELFKENSGVNKIDEGYNYLIYKVAQETVKHFLDFEIGQLKDGNTIKIWALEKRLEHSISFKNIEIKIKGTIDRIDVFNGKFRIIDYKTGKVEPEDLKIEEWKDQIQDKAMQLSIYKYLFLNQFKHEEQNCEAGIFCTSKLNKELMLLELPDLEQNNIVEQIENVLRRLFEEIFDEKQPFVQTEDIKNCGYCDFKIICGRNKKS